MGKSCGKLKKCIAGGVPLCAAPCPEALRHCGAWFSIASRPAGGVMGGSAPLAPDAGVNYRYDGTFEGLMCCVFESFSAGERPAKISGPDAAQLSLFGEKEIWTDTGRAGRVARSIPEKIAPDALDFVQRAFLTCLPEKERYILAFLRKGFRLGAKVMDMLADPVVDALACAVRRLGGEAHLLSGFIRFSELEGVLAAEITPNNYVLPLLAPHFAGRYPGEKFLIHDKTHGVALVHEAGNMEIVDAAGLSMPAPGEQELRFRALWRLFYDTIAIEGRYNPKCRRTHMPKRYWVNMTEFSAEGGRADPEDPNYARGPGKLGAGGRKRVPAASAK